MWRKSVKAPKAFHKSIDFKATNDEQSEFDVVFAVRKIQTDFRLKGWKGSLPPFN